LENFIYSRLEIKIYNSAIEKAEKSVPEFYDYIIGRSQAFLKLGKYAEALNDAKQAIEINENDSRAYLKKGIALYNLNTFEEALNVFEQGLRRAEGESNTKLSLFVEWMDKSSKMVQKTTSTSSEASQETKKEQSSNQTQAPPVQQTFK
jgi:suppressor of G2 allele of SKP1